MADLIGLARRDLAQRLAQAGHDAGVHPTFGVVMFCHGRVWKVMGGNEKSPSLICKPAVRASEVAWATVRERKEA